MNLKLDWQTVAKAVKGTLLAGGEARGALRAGLFYRRPSSFRAGDGNRPFDSFVTDSRKVSRDQTFWALKGKKHDAHAFLDDTLKKGALGWVIEKNSRPSINIGKPQYVIEVSDTLKALGALAAFHRRRFDIPLAAITGSNGKSTTKEMLACICAQCAGTAFSPGSLNNQFGLPLSILELEAGRHSYGVFELGASRKGDIREIAGIARPTVGVLTNIAPAHLEFFGDMETIYRTKTELLEFIQPQGTIVYNADDPFLSRLTPPYPPLMKGRGPEGSWRGNRLTFGFCKTADVRIMDESRTFKLLHKDRTHAIRDLPMRYDRLNAAGAAAAALAMGIGWESIISGLERFRPLPMRMQVEKRGNASIFLDAYNANPESMRAAVSSILEQNSSAPVCIILGDMKELGDSSGFYHEELGSWLASLPLDRIFLAGTEMKAAAGAAVKAGAADRLVYAEVPEHWMGKLRAQLKLGGTYLIKASRTMQFEKILDKL